MPELTFPWPPRQLFPNYKRAHYWTSYRKYEQAARTLGFGLAAEALGPSNLRKFQHEGELEISLEFTPPLRPGPVADEDNTIAACKHYLDGLSAALGVNDSRFRQARPVWREREGAGKIIISWGEHATDEA